MSITFPIPFDAEINDLDFRAQVFILFNDIYTVQLETDQLPIPFGIENDEINFRNDVESIFTDLYDDKFNVSMPLPLSKDVEMKEWSREVWGLFNDIYSTQLEAL